LFTSQIEPRSRWEPKVPWGPNSYLDGRVKALEGSEPGERLQRGEAPACAHSPQVSAERLPSMPGGSTGIEGAVPALREPKGEATL